MNETQKKPTLLAVYGTLRKGFGNWRAYLDNEFSAQLGTMRTEPNFRMVSLTGFPGVIPVKEGGKSVTVEIFAVTNDRVLRNIDMLEGYPTFYQKTTIQTEWGEASMYILNEKFLKYDEVENGDWSEYLNARRNVKV